MVEDGRKEEGGEEEEEEEERKEGWDESIAMSRRGRRRGAGRDSPA